METVIPAMERVPFSHISLKRGIKMILIYSTHHKSVCLGGSQRTEAIDVVYFEFGIVFWQKCYWVVDVVWLQPCWGWCTSTGPTWTCFRPWSTWPLLVVWLSSLETACWPKKLSRGMSTDDICCKCLRERVLKRREPNPWEEGVWAFTLLLHLGLKPRDHVCSRLPRWCFQNPK